MAMVPATLIDALTGLWTEPPIARDITETGDAIEALWITAAVAGSVSSATLFTPGVTHSDLSALGNNSTPTEAAQAFEDACTAMIVATTFTAVAPATIAPPAIPAASTPGTLSDVLKPIFDAPEAGTSASTQANSIGAAIHTFLAGWTVAVTIPPAAAVPTAIL
jgi:hypothetical protein